MGVVVDPASVYGRAILRGVMRYANLQRRWVLHEDLWRATETLRHFPRCDGAILAGVGQETVSFVQDRCRHTIYCSGGANPAITPMVALDDHAAGRLAAQHLMDCRLEHFAFFGSRPDWIVPVARMDGFRAALQERGYECELCPVPWPMGLTWLTHEHRPALVRWLRKLAKPVGIFAADDAIAHDLAGACLEADINVPDEVAIVGVNNDDLLCEGAWPPLSSVEADYLRVGYHAATMLDRLLAGESLTDEERCVRLQPLGVVQRQSTSVLAVDDPDLASAVRFIREHACDPCNVQDVLRHVPVGRRWLERQFASYLNRTPHDEIQRVRIDTACRLLLQPELTIPTIAFRCGYSAVQNFNVTFRQLTATTPAAYRRKALQGHAPRAADRKHK